MERSLITISLFLTFVIIGYMMPFRKIESSFKRRLIRWAKNISFSLIYIIFSKLVLTHIYPDSTSFPAAPIVIMQLFILDLAIYLQHLLTHKVPVLWRLHRLHHSDTEFDTTTAFRFHPLELLFSFIYKALIMITFQIPGIVVVVYEVILNSCALFNHSNFEFPESIEKVLRKVIVTPGFHRIHHSSRQRETNSNYSSTLSLWDYLFRTYVEHSKINPKKMDIGLKEFRSQKEQRFLNLLKQPFT